MTVTAVLNFNLLFKYMACCVIGVDDEKLLGFHIFSSSIFTHRNRKPSFYSNYGQREDGQVTGENGQEASCFTSNS